MRTTSASRRRHAVFRYYAELNDFLPPARRFVSFAHTFELPGTVKDMIESMGVPHTEVDLILIDGKPVDFCHPVQDGDRISVYPPFKSLDTRSLLQLRTPQQDRRFVLDAHLGRLARYLRVLGFDSAYEADRDDKELAQISRYEERTLLTRDCGLLKRARWFMATSSERRSQSYRWSRLSGDSIYRPRSLPFGVVFAATPC